MQFYNTPADHIKMIVDGLGRDLGGVEFEDYTEAYQRDGYSSFTYVIGDVEPLGVNSIGQQAHNIELELRVIVPVSKSEYGGHSPQMYCLGVATKITAYLRTKFYGLADQRELPDIEVNRAIPINDKKNKVFCGRSIVFTQVIYLGKDTETESGVNFEMVEYDRA